MGRAEQLAGGILIIVSGCSAAADPSSAITSRPPASAEPARSSPSAVSTPSPEDDASTSQSPEVSVFAPGTISTDDEEYRISFTPDGQTAYFARGTGFFPQTQQATIMESRLVDGAWTEPTVASFSGAYPDIDPWVAPDGTSIYFSSIRPVAGEPRRDADVWRVDREGDGWGEPVHLPAVSSGLNELGASIAADGVLWFASDRAGRNWNLYTAQPSGTGFAAPEPVTDFNTALWEYNPAISPAGDLLVFTSIGREGSGRFGDLYFATRSNGEWSVELPLPTNTSADDYHASFSPDGETLYFVRRVGDGDIYAAEWPSP